MAKAKTPKPKTCKICLTEFTSYRSTQKVCSVPCSIKFAAIEAKRKEEKELRRQRSIERQELKVRKEKLKTKSDWNREAQTAVNKYIFWRDYGQPCIACGRALNYGVRGGAVDASHYRSRGSASHLRFNLFNIHAGCVQCNRDLSGNIIPYRINLIEKIGAERVTQLEHNNEPRKFDIDYLKRVKQIFTRRARYYEKQRKREYMEAA
ncbi:recombination protein NinG [Xenorhabdus bovienii]|uniref:recombination protein NinG n=1 Tax=Xenorhabdus bovienii TaxID=40576 RepID=UPI001EDD1D8C|nr:recombination protein NinG [Xenorhabdus bovienii]MCG3463433.1 recombination protein NinG [Xenorhabdus bovienii]